MQPDSVRRFGFGVDSAAAGVDCPPHCSLDRHARDPLVEERATRVERLVPIAMETLLVEREDAHHSILKGLAKQLHTRRINNINIT